MSGAAKTHAGDLDALARRVADDVVDDLRRAEERARAEARRIVLEAQDYADDLARAARRLGSARGSAVAQAAERAGAAEAQALHARALDAVFERLLARLATALSALPGTERHAAALAHWAREAVQRAPGPVEVSCEAALRPAVYDALLAAGLVDLRVLADPRVRVGFVVRDLDGRLVLDRRPEALLAERRAELRHLLEQRLSL